MADLAKKRRDARIRRHHRVRKTMRGTAQRPRVAVFRSNRHISAQVIDDIAGVTLAAVSTTEAAVSALETLESTLPAWLRNIDLGTRFEMRRRTLEANQRPATSHILNLPALLVGVFLVLLVPTLMLTFTSFSAFCMSPAGDRIGFGISVVFTQVAPHHGSNPFWQP